MDNIDASEVPVGSLKAYFPDFLKPETALYIQMNKYTNIQMNKWTNLQIYKYTNMQIYQYTNIQRADFTVECYSWS